MEKLYYTCSFIGDEKFNATLGYKLGLYKWMSDFLTKNHIREFLFTESTIGDFEDFLLGVVGAYKEKYLDIRCILLKEFCMRMMLKDMQTRWIYDYSKLFEYDKYKEDLAESRTTVKIQHSDICVFYINKESAFINKMLTLAKMLNKKIVIISKKEIKEVTQ